MMAESIAICVPVRDEALRLPRFLDAMAAQDGPAFTLCLLFDGCTDASEAVVAARSLPFRVAAHSLPRAEPNAGRARRGAMALGQGDILISTDADSVPAPGWLAANLRALGQADVVAGRIVRRGSACPVQDRVERYYDALFALRRRLDPVAWEAPFTHHYASGASLALRAETYAALGGFEAVPAGEDARLVDAAQRAGYRVRRDAAVVVETSSRRHGRAQGGLADHLRELDRTAALPEMAHPEDCAWRYCAQAAARAAFGGDLTLLAHRLARPLHELAALAAVSRNAEAFATCAVSAPERIVPLDVAEEALARLHDEPERDAA